MAGRRNGGAVARSDCVIPNKEEEAEGFTRDVGVQVGWQVGIKAELGIPVDRTVRLRAASRSARSCTFFHPDLKYKIYIMFFTRICMK